jgi:hypothetical protein
MINYFSIRIIKEQPINWVSIKFFLLRKSLVYILPCNNNHIKTSMFGEVVPFHRRVKKKGILG